MIYHIHWWSCAWLLIVVFVLIQYGIFILESFDSFVEVAFQQAHLSLTVNLKLTFCLFYRLRVGDATIALQYILRVPLSSSPSS